MVGLVDWLWLTVQECMADLPRYVVANECLVKMGEEEKTQEEQEKAAEAEAVYAAEAEAEAEGLVVPCRALNEQKPCEECNDLYCEEQTKKIDVQVCVCVCM